MSNGFYVLLYISVKVFRCFGKFGFHFFSPVRNKCYCIYVNTISVNTNTNTFCVGEILHLV